MITRIEAHRYRCLEKLGIDLDKYAVLVGANGAGKTTFLDIPVLLAELLGETNFSLAFTQARNYTQPPRTSSLRELIFAGRGDDFILAVEAKLPDGIVRQLLVDQTGTVQENKEKWLTHIRYEMRVSLFNDMQLEISNEYCFLFSVSTVPDRDSARLHGEVNQMANRKKWRFIIDREPRSEAQIRAELPRKEKPKAIHADPKLLALPRIQYESAEEFPASRWLLDLLMNGTIFYEPNIQKLQVASPTGLGDKLLPDASNLPHLALALKTHHLDRYEDWISHIQTALPQIITIDVKVREDDRHAYFVITYKGGHKVSSFGLSEGTLRILALTIVPYLINPPALIITEEPENGIHPRAIESILQSLSSVYGSQVLISSHSPVALAQSSLEHILCSRVSSTGAAEIIPGHLHPRLKDWQGSIDLGALFATGVLG